ncbi:transcriptional regulator [Nonomuraea sp. NPDC049269]|uniref:transcriptional regulator n=1 Tax=Nonomuraea sp. NPDC049269 TaxID=3364349 RepID=UPI00371D283C
MFVAFRITTWALDLPAPATIAAAATVVTAIPANPLIRRIYRGVIQQDRRHGLMDPFFNGFLHVPARLSIVALLAPASGVEFGFLRDTIKTGDSALSEQISALAEAGYVWVRTSQETGTRRTYVQLTPEGRRAFERHAAALERIVAVAQAQPQPHAGR